MATIKTFGELKEGDVLPGADGSEVAITKAYDVHTPERMFELTLSDGRTTQAGGTHLWYIVLDEDWGMLSQRKSEVRKTVNRLPNGVYALLEEMAHHDVIEESYSGLLEVLQTTHDEDFGLQIGRVLESIGPIVEETHELRDLLDDSTVQEQVVPYYNAALASAQILSLAGKKPWKKTHPALPGRVVTTEELVELSQTNEIDIPAI